MKFSDHLRDVARRLDQAEAAGDLAAYQNVLKDFASEVGVSIASGVREGLIQHGTKFAENGIRTFLERLLTK